MNPMSAILPLRTRTHMVPLALGAATWLAGVLSIYVAAPFAVGTGFFGAYAAFGAGANFGNLLALGIFTLWAVLVLLVLRGSRLGPATSILGAHGLIGIGVYYPAAVMSFGMAHVVGYEDDAPEQGLAAMGLVASGGGALLLLLGTLAGRGIFNRAARFLRTGRATASR